MNQLDGLLTTLASLTVAFIEQFAVDSIDSKLIVCILCNAPLIDPPVTRAAGSVEREQFGYWMIQVATVVAKVTIVIATAERPFVLKVSKLLFESKLLIQNFKKAARSFRYFSIPNWIINCDLWDQLHRWSSWYLSWEWSLEMEPWIRATLKMLCDQMTRSLIHNSRMCLMMIGLLWSDFYDQTSIQW